MCQEEDIRNKAIRLIVNKFFPDERLKDPIRAFAVANIEGLASKSSGVKSLADDGGKYTNTKKNQPFTYFCFFLILGSLFYREL